jgi:Fe-S-cluster containining protein
MTRSSVLAAGYRESLEQIDQWFNLVVQQNPGVIACHRGCSACCHGPFDISLADHLLVQEGFLALASSDQATVLERARAQVHQMLVHEPDWDLATGIGGLGEDRFDRVSDLMSQEPCPLLDDTGRCRIYDHRPLVCRMMGLGIVTPMDRLIENACPILDQFPLYSALPAQPFDLETFEAAEMAYNEAAAVELVGTPGMAGFETTIALALVNIAEKSQPGK